MRNRFDVPINYYMEKEREGKRKGSSDKLLVSTSPTFLFLVLQVKEANKLLKGMSKNGGKKKVEGVPVFSARNLDIAIASTNGIKW